MINLIKNLFKIAKLLSVDDSGDFRFAQVSALGKTQKILMFSPYGLMHNPPESAMVLQFSQQAQESNGIGIADDPKNRTIKNLATGEVALGNYLTNDYIYFDENGDCYLKLTNDLIETIGNDKIQTILGDKTETITGDKISVISGGKSETISGTSTSNTTGVSIIGASSFEINGNSDNLVTWADLSSILAGYWSQFNSHSHVSAGANDTTVSFDIAAAKATTLKTDG